MDKAKETFLAAAPESARIVLARGGRSEVVNSDRHAGDAGYEGRALPLLLRERWAIRSTIPASEGMYFVLARSADIEDPPSSRAMGLR